MIPDANAWLSIEGAGRCPRRNIPSQLRALWPPVAAGGTLALGVRRPRRLLAGFAARTGVTHAGDPIAGRRRVRAGLGASTWAEWARTRGYRICSAHLLIPDLDAPHMALPLQAGPERTGLFHRACEVALFKTDLPRLPAVFRWPLPAIGGVCRTALAQRLLPICGGDMVLIVERPREASDA